MLDTLIAKVRDWSITAVSYQSVFSMQQEQAKSHGFNAKKPREIKRTLLARDTGKNMTVCAKPNRYALAYISGWVGRFELLFLY